jgi:hypothetical protein
MDSLLEELIFNISLYNNSHDNVYTNVELLKGKLIQLIKESQTSMVNRCLECGIDMGECNPRQLCGKVYCDSK